MVSAFEGNRAETKTILPVITAFMTTHQLPDVTVVADAGMVSEANQKAIEAAGLSFILGAYHQLFQIEKSFRIAKSDLQARPVYYRTRDSIEAHLTIVFAALAVSRWIEHHTGWSIRKFVKTARRYRTVQIQAGDQVVTAAEPLPDDLRVALSKISNAPGWRALI
jgi:transposase